MEISKRIAGVASSTAVAAFATLGVATSAHASDVGACMTRIDVVQADLSNICSGGRIGGNNEQRTCDSLSSKLSGANTKLSQGKNADAMQKLVDFKNAIIAMRDARKPKISAADAGQLLDGTSGSEGDNGAIECVALLP